MSCRDPVAIKSICAKCERTAGRQEAEQVSEKKVFKFVRVENLVGSRHARSFQRVCIFGEAAERDVLKTLQ